MNGLQVFNPFNDGFLKVKLNRFKTLPSLKYWDLLPRYNEKVTLELELAELRKQRNAEWEKTKHHLKLAKSKNSFVESGGAADVNNSRDSFV